MINAHFPPVAIRIESNPRESPLLNFTVFLSLSSPTTWKKGMLYMHSILVHSDVLQNNQAWKWALSTFYIELLTKNTKQINQRTKKKK